MADIQASPQQNIQISLSKQISPRDETVLPPPASLSLSSAAAIRTGQSHLDTFSPVNQNGSFEFDRVLKSGEVYKRTRKTRQWKKYFLVLRPNLLSVYKSASEERLLKQISLSELTAVAYLKDPKRRRDHMFGLFSPSRNFHLQAKDAQDTRTWVELIKREARIDEEEHEMLVGSPTTNEGPYHRVEGVAREGEDRDRWEQERMTSSSPELVDLPSRISTTRDGVKIPGIQKLSTHDLDYSGNDPGSYSDFSDTPISQSHAPQSSASLPQQRFRRTSEANVVTDVLNANQPLPETPSATQPSGLHTDQDDERVVWHGYLLCLKTKGGVRQWKRLWTVLRPKNLAFYKNEEEYAAKLIIPLSNIISAVEIDPVSKSKSNCMQIIVEEESYKFCAPSEDALAKWLGALKSQLARKKEANLRKANAI